MICVPQICDNFHFGIERSENVYATALRDEVLGEWHVTESQNLQLHLHCRVGLSWTPIPLMYLRNYVFRKDMPMVVDALLQVSYGRRLCTSGIIIDTEIVDYRRSVNLY